MLVKGEKTGRGISLLKPMSKILVREILAIGKEDGFPDCSPFLQFVPCSQLVSLSTWKIGRGRGSRDICFPFPKFGGRESATQK